MTTTRYYSGWQRERAGFLFNLTGVQFTLVLAATVCLAAPVMTGSLAVLFVTWPVAFLLAALTWIRVLGRTAPEWSGLAARFVLNRTRGQNRFLAGAFAPRDPADPAAQAPMDLPGPLAPLRFLQADTGGLLGALAGERIAVVHHPLDDTWTAIARIRYPGIALADHAHREARIGGWGAYLAQLCSEASVFGRVAVVQRTVPDDGAALRGWHRHNLKLDAPDVAIATVEDLLAHSVLTASQQESWLVLTLEGARARTQINAAGGGDLGALAVLVRQVAAATAAIGGAHLEVVRWLDVRELAEVVRTAFDPASMLPIAERRNDAGSAGVDPRLAGPAAAQAGWAYYRHDSGFSVTYEVSEWPRTGVPAWFLRPLLAAHQTGRRSFSLVVEPVAPRRAERLVMQDRTKRSVAVRLRHKSGQLVPEHELKALADAESMDRQRAEGHGLVRFVAYLTVTVTEVANLELACSELETDAGQCGLAVRRMWGAQDVGFFAGAMPLGLGLPRARSWA